MKSIRDDTLFVYLARAADELGLRRLLATCTYQARALSRGLALTRSSPTTFL